MARHDFSVRVPISGTDTIDAMATGLNMLAEELEVTVASRRELEEANARLVDSGRMAAIGMLAAGVAHEVNNPAAWVSLALGMVRRGNANLRRILTAEELDRDAALAEIDVIDPLLADCVDGMQRITTVVGDLRLFSRGDEHRETIELDEVIRSCCRLASHALEGTRVVVENDGAPLVIANRGRVAQIVTNLVVNAAHAVANAEEREIAILTSTLDHGALLAVEDTGAGIAEAIEARVFEPFFTTKPGALGMGLGLTIVSQIAASYGGWARIKRPAVRRGARVEVWLPAAGGVTERASAVSAP